MNDLLISPKGNLLLPYNDTYRSDNYSLLEALGVRISKTYLISSYDIYYDLMPDDPETIPYTEILFVDSGGYEINNSFESHDRNKFNYHVNPWCESKMKNIYKRLDSSDKLSTSTKILTTFDLYSDFSEQLTHALDTKREFPNMHTNFLIKPFTNSIQDLQLAITKEQDRIKDVPVLGFTEKELGATIRERIINLITIRDTLSSIQWLGYIHLYIR